MSQIARSRRQWFPPITTHPATLSFRLFTFAILISLLASQCIATGEVRPAKAASPSAVPAPQTDSTHIEATQDKGYRFDRGGWTYVHLEGSPHESATNMAIFSRRKLPMLLPLPVWNRRMKPDATGNFSAAPRARCSGLRLIPNTRLSCRGLRTASRRRKLKSILTTSWRSTHFRSCPITTSPGWKRRRTPRTREPRRVQVIAARLSPPGAGRRITKS